MDVVDPSDFSRRSIPLLRLNSICPYYTMFPIAFPLAHLAAAKPGEWVFDPFCGRGTTSFAARLKSLPSVSIDNNPIATAIAAAKLVSPTPEQIIEEAEHILSTEELAAAPPHGPFWELAFHPKTLEDICRIRQALLRSQPANSMGTPDEKMRCGRRSHPPARRFEH